MSLPRVKNGPQIETHDIEGRREEMEVIEGKQVQRVDIVAVHPPAVGDAAPGPIQGPSGQGRDLNDQCKRIYDIVAATGTYNFMGARCPVPSAFDIPAWRRRLAGYRDAGILQYLQYGWPINFNRFSPLCPTDRNHPSAVNFQEDIEHYLRTERGHGALLGPFAGQPVEHAHSSPLMTRPKKDARYGRVIVDLSWPQGASINDGVDQVHYLDGPATVKLPTAEYMVQRILQLGTGAWLYKTDLARGYRQLRVDPLDWPFLGFRHGGSWYLDACPPFGLRSAAMCMQRTSEAICYMHEKEGFLSRPYLDDFGGAEAGEERALRALRTLQAIMRELGVAEAEHKVHLPAQRMVWHHIRHGGHADVHPSGQDGRDHGGLAAVGWSDDDHPEGTTGTHRLVTIRSKRVASGADFYESHVAVFARHTYQGEARSLLGVSTGSALLPRLVTHVQRGKDHGQEGLAIPG